MLAAGITCLPVAASLVMALAYIVLLLSTLPLRNIITQGAIFGGIGVHVLCQMFLNITEGTPAASAYVLARGPLIVSLLIFLITALLTMNRFSLDTSMPEGRGVPEIIRRRNRLLVWLMLGAALLISLIPAPGRLLDMLWRWLRQAVSTVIQWLFALLPQQTTGSQLGAGSMDAFPMGQSATPSTMLLWLENLLLAVSGAAAVLFLLWVLRILWKKLCVLVRCLSERMQLYAASATEDYVDDVQDTRI